MSSQYNGPSNNLSFWIADSITFNRDDDPTAAGSAKPGAKQQIAGENVQKFDDLSFRFNRQMIRLKTNGIFSRSSSSPAPNVAYLELEWVRSRRNESVKLASRDNFDELVHRLRKKLQARLQPTDEAEDPYIAAVLIAQAQEQRWQDAESEAAEGKTVPDTTASYPTPSNSNSSEPPPPNTIAMSQETARAFKVCLYLKIVA
ncbi:hypothetical protein DV735_g235, partial [Chaetothyriales sp. CBS 134920]